MSRALEMELPAPAPAAADGGMNRRVARNSLWLIGQPLLLNVISIVSTGYIARNLGAAEYGAFNLGYAQTTLFAPLCYLGLRGVTVRAIAQDRSNAEATVRTVFALRMALTLLAALLTLAWLTLPTYSPTTRAIGAAAVLSMVFTSSGMVAVDLFQGFERSRLAAQPQIAGGLTLTILSVLALLCGLGLPGFVAAYLTGHALQMGLLHWNARRHFFTLKPGWDSTRARELVRQAKPFAAQGLMGFVLDVGILDVLVLGALFAAPVVGPYTAAMGLITRFLIVPLGIGDAIYPAVACAYGENPGEVRKTVRRYIVNLALITLPVSLGLTLAAPTVLWVLFGDQYLPAAVALRIAAWVIPLYGLGYLIRECLNAIHRQGEVVRLNVVSGATMLVLCWLLIPRYGLAGAALSGTLREIVMLPLWLRAFGRHFPRPLPLGELGRVALAGAALCLPLGAAVLTLTNPFLIVGAGLLGAAAYGGAAVLLGMLNVRSLPLPRRAGAEA